MGMRALFNNYFYGKPDKADYTEANQPQNRRQLFREVLRARGGALVGVNLMALLWWLPAVLWSFLNLVQLNQAAEAAEFARLLDGLLFSYLLILFPLIALTGPFNVALGYVLRNWARDEHSFLWADFKSALKENWRQGLAYGLVSGFAPLLVFLCARFYAGFAALSAAFYLPLAITLIAALIWFLSAPILPTLIVTYRQGFFSLAKNAILLTLVALPRAILVRLITLALPLLILACALSFPAALSWLAPVALVFYAVILIAFNKLIWASHANALCEKYLNPKIAGARTNIGLRAEKMEAEK